MPKVIFLGDMHIGARNASPIVADFQIRFFEEILFPYMKKNNITQILQFGDVFDTRKFSNHVILHKWKIRVFDYMLNNDIIMSVILGNHDTASKNTLKVNTPSLLLAEYENINIVDRPKNITYCGAKLKELFSGFELVNILCVPWVCQDNREEIEELVKTTDAIYCAGHFEFDGFEMHRGQKAVGGYSTKEYEKFDMVFSGHFHTRSRQNNIQYLGTPYEMSWIDYCDTKGFHVFDTAKHSVEFIENPLTLFNRIEYNDKETSPQIDVSLLKDTYVKVVAINKDDAVKFDSFINNILLVNPADLKIVDIETDFTNIETDDTIDISDTKALMESFVTQIETNLEKPKLTDMLNSLYVQALEICE